MIRIVAALAATMLLASLASPAEARRQAADPSHAAGQACHRDEDRGGGRISCHAAVQAVSHLAARRSGGKGRGKGQAHRRASKGPDQARPAKGGGSAVVRSKTGATASVGPAYRARFQKYVDLLEAEGARIYYMGGLPMTAADRRRRGRCSIPRNKHPCGMALDVCQDARGRVSGARDCRLPTAARMAALASAAGLVEGGIWCRGDLGHAEIPTKGQARQCADPFGTAKAKRSRVAAHEVNRWTAEAPAIAR